MKKSVLYIILPAILIFSVAFTVNKNDKYFEIAKNIEIFSNLYKELNTYYVDELDPGSLMKIGIDAMLGSLDPYTNYFSETQMEGFRYLSEGRFDGTGAKMRNMDGYITIVEVFQPSPAKKAGLKVGDKILEVNGANAKGKNTDEMLDILRGAPGSEVILSIERPGEKEIMEISLIRGSVNVKNVPHSKFVADDIGYIPLTTFTNNAGKNVANKLRDLKTENPNIKAVILDLRDNGGGLLREAINVSNVFIDKNELVVSTKGKVEDWDQVYTTHNEPVDLDLKVVVLINKSSASASEIVSGVIQDLDRGVLVGQRSYGKGLVQNMRDIGYNSKIKLTTSKYYIPSGRCIQSVEYEDGEPKDIADALRTPFKTRKGRTVLDGGGVLPDVFVEPSKKSTLLTRLEKQHVIFDFVTDYTLKHKTIDSVEAFSFNDYPGFLKFVDKSDFTYKTETEEALEKMLKVLQEEEMNAPVQSEIERIQSLIEKEKGTHLQKYKSEIMEAIEMEIVGRYYFMEGKIKQQSKNDADLKKAIEVLNDDALYNSLLK